MLYFAIRHVLRRMARSKFGRMLNFVVKSISQLPYNFIGFLCRRAFTSSSTIPSSHKCPWKNINDDKTANKFSEYWIEMSCDATVNSYQCWEHHTIPEHYHIALQFPVGLAIFRTGRVGEGVIN